MVSGKRRLQVCLETEDSSDEVFVKDSNVYFYTYQNYNRKYSKDTIKWFVSR